MNRTMLHQKFLDKLLKHWLIIQKEKFLDKFYSETNKNELTATSVFLTNQVNAFSSELAEMEKLYYKSKPKNGRPYLNSETALLSTKKAYKTYEKNSK